MTYRDAYDELDLISEEIEAPVLDAAKHPTIAFANTLAAALFKVLGPMCWAALIVLFLVAQFSSN
jgi:hypothetical protein